MISGHMMTNLWDDAHIVKLHQLLTNSFHLGVQPQLSINVQIWPHSDTFTSDLKCNCFLYAKAKHWILFTIPKSSLRPQKWPPNDPKFRDFSCFYKTYLKIKKKNFHSDFLCLEGGGVDVEPPSPPLNVYFQPPPN